MHQTKITSVNPTQSLSHVTHIPVCMFIIGLSFLIRFLCLSHYNLLVEEAYYWNYAQHLDFGYLDHPPMVAFLIKISTTLFGTNEFALHLPALICWMITVFFCVKLTNLVNRNASMYVIFLLSVLPFFFLESLVITPDQPMLVCWSGALYSLYRALVLNEAKYWYVTGVFIGLGMLSKYSIVLLGPATIIYLLLVPSARFLFLRKEPYLCALIAALLFTPVIYWNATHHWASFAFQGSRRFADPTTFCFHHFIAILILFLMPLGLVHLCDLYRTKKLEESGLNPSSWKFFQTFTLFPLVFFGAFSITHNIKLDWLGPGLLAILPWFAILIHNNAKYRLTWYIASTGLLIGYSVFIGFLMFGPPKFLPHIWFQKFISWEDLTLEVSKIAAQVEQKSHEAPIIIPVDLYNIGSELSFYQAKLQSHGAIDHSYSIVGRHIFGLDSLMYRYWATNSDIKGKDLILISANPLDFEANGIQSQIIAKTPILKFWSHSQGRAKININPYYYQIARKKTQRFANLTSKNRNKKRTLSAS